MIPSNSIRFITGGYVLMCLIEEYNNCVYIEILSVYSIFCFVDNLN